MNKVLIIHHLEETWEQSYKKKGRSFLDLCYEFVEHLEETQYDRVILTQFEEWRPQSGHRDTGLAFFVTDWFDYGYGWTADQVADELENVAPQYQNKYVEGGQHSEMVLVADWMEELVGHDVYISGAFDGECLEDLEIALEALHIPFTRVNQLIL